MTILRSLRFPLLEHFRAFEPSASGAKAVLADAWRLSTLSRLPEEDKRLQCFRPQHRRSNRKSTRLHLSCIIVYSLTSDRTTVVDQQTRKHDAEAIATRALKQNRIKQKAQAKYCRIKQKAQAKQDQAKGSSKIGSLRKETTVSCFVHIIRSTHRTNRSYKNPH